MNKEKHEKNKPAPPDKGEDRTSIQCMPSTREQLKKMCRAKESYDKALLRIMKGYNGCRCEWVNKLAPEDSEDILMVVFDKRKIEPGETLREFIMKNLTEQLQYQGIDLDSRIEG